MWDGKWCIAGYPSWFWRVIKNSEEQNSNFISINHVPRIVLAICVLPCFLVHWCLAFNCFGITSMASGILEGIRTCITLMHTINNCNKATPSNIIYTILWYTVLYGYRNYLPPAVTHDTFSHTIQKLSYNIVRKLKKHKQESHFIASFFFLVDLHINWTVSALPVIPATVKQHYYTYTSVRNNPFITLL